MRHFIYSMRRHHSSYSLWASTAPIREELFGLERLEEHAISLAKAQKISDITAAVLPLHKRLDQNSVALLDLYRDSAAELEAGRKVVPAAEWLLDNYHLVEEQIRNVRDDLPVGYYRQLPKLMDGPLAGYPRVFGLAWAFIAHTDSHIDPDVLTRFINAYQTVQPLTIGELWAVAITLRIVLIENLRRLADQIAAGRAQRIDADQLTEKLLIAGCSHSALKDDINSRSAEHLSEVFAAQLAKRLRDQDPKTTPALEWLERRLKAQGLTVDEVVQHAQQRQGASNVSIRNVITSMHLISDIDWSELFEKVSHVDRELRADCAFATMDFSTRNLYRSAVEQISRGTDYSEVEIAKCAIQTAKDAYNDENIKEIDVIEKQRLSDTGYYLIDQGRIAFENSVRYKPTLRIRISRLHVRLGVAGYVGTIAIIASCFLGLSLFFFGAKALSWQIWGLWFAVGFIPATEVASAIVHRLVTWRFGAVVLPGLELKLGIPTSLRTLIAVPTLLTSEADLQEQIERLEVHYLSGIAGDVSFALLTDGVDADQEELANDVPLLALATAEIARLNTLYNAGPGGSRFILLHRRRQYNSSEKVWMGWERKRGKLHELNRLLRGATDTSYITVNGVKPKVPTNVRYVITLDADTRLPREAALRLIGKMAHPLNRPQLDQEKQRVVKGYGILQPRVTPSLSVGYEGSLFQRIFSAPGGIDPYAAAISDVYQDLFGEGSFTGKGIYDVDAFEAALENRIAENTILSHDLFEGNFARAGLVSDVEVVEEFPARYDVAAKRQHRWIRGDWQLLPWVFGDPAGQHGMSALGRWKLIDNLRRSLVAPTTLLALALCWLFPPVLALFSTGLLLATIAIPAFIPSVFSFIPRHSDIDPRNHFRLWAGDVRLAFNQTIFTIALLPDQSWRTLDAIGRTLIRLWITGQHRLEWSTAANCNAMPRLTIVGFYRAMAEGLILGSAICLMTVILNPSALPLIAIFFLLWLFAPVIALYTSRSPVIINTDELNVDAMMLRLTARRTWRYFETFVTSADNMLPPDNFQEDPEPVIAHRTSPTNIGLYLLSSASAHDFGWAGLLETIERLEECFATLKLLPKHNGHFFNWYGTESLTPLLPEYVSSVDSGNLAGHLIALANACDEWRQTPAPRAIRLGVMDNLKLAYEAIAAQSSTLNSPLPSVIDHPLVDILDDIANKLNSLQSTEALSPILLRLTDKAIKLADDSAPSTQEHGAKQTIHNQLADVAFWLNAVRKLLIEQQRDQVELTNAQDSLNGRLASLAKIARAMALAMDFGFLMNKERKLLSIGFSLAENSLDPSCYDLLASEARLASLFAIAKGDVPTKHWFHLGRSATPMGNGSALISWSGSMFEYLMPSLVMRAPAGSLLEQTNRLIVQRQQQYGSDLAMPWGVSESAYYARDFEFTYQYSNFGVPGLGLKRGLAENRVIAPYATGLATMIAPRAAVLNFIRLTEMGALGRFGFYEALDYTATRLPVKTEFAIVRSYMSHHQGMTIVAIANALHQGQVRKRFHQEPMIQACELLLQERMPRNVSVSHPRAEEVKVSTSISTEDTPTIRRLDASADGAPVTHLLSNGSYAVMLTSGGAGYSRWRDIAVTRWQEDSTCDQYGSFIFMRDLESGKLWSSGVQPLDGERHYPDGVFEEDRAEFVRHDDSLTTTMEVLVSGEDDGEVRRISLTNNGRQAMNIEVTSYIELVLTTAAIDNAHPAFAKMFVQTEYLAEYGALIASRRKRSADDPSVWAAHFAIVEGDITADPQYETNRALFIGRGNTIATATAFNRNLDSDEAECSSLDLTNSVGTVLDPMFSLRHRVLVAAGGVTRVAFWTVVAASREALLDLIDRHHDRSAYDRAKTLAWTQAQVQLRHLNISSGEAADFQRLAAPILYADPRFRASAEAINRGMMGQSLLWTHSISGDLPIVLLLIDDIEDIEQVKQLLRAHEYWRMKRLAVDLVIINEHACSYLQDLQIAIETAVRSSQSSPRLASEFNGVQVKGSVYMLRADLMTVQARDLLKAAARVVLNARRGSISKHIARLPPAPIWNRQPHSLPLNSSEDLTADPASSQKELAALKQNLEFFNGLGGFSQNGREYTVILKREGATPAPWINVIANPNFGFHVAAEGSGYTWAENSRENQLTPWCNDPVSNPSGEAIYVRDEETLELFSATAQPIHGDVKGRIRSDSGPFIAHHGRGYSRFEHQTNGIGLTLLQYVPLADPIKISRLTLHNQSGRRRQLSVTAYIEWVLGTSRGASGPFITTDLDVDSNAIFISNRWNIAFPRRVAFADMNGMQSTWTADRTEFLGRNGGADAPAALVADASLSGRLGAGLDPCTAQQAVVDLDVGESIEVVLFMGQCTSVKKAQALIARYRQLDLNSVLTEVTEYWDNLLGAVQVTTPDRAMDIMLNGWLLYQTVACRLWARSAFYQASGAYGFRDQLQDGMSLTFRRPDLTREHILRAAGRQFVEGDVQHWWLPHTGQGVRTRISDDRVWLAFATANYVQTSEDTSILDERVAFIDGPPLAADQHDAFFQAMPADESATLFEHCARGLDQCLELTGEYGLPLMGTGDWNDGMNRVGQEGKGESIWLGWLFIRTINLFAPLVSSHENDERLKRWLDHADRVKHAIEDNAWDGEWYRRASLDDGGWLGSTDNDECQIDAIAQSWAVLSDAGDPKRAAMAMNSVEQRLIKAEQGLSLLFTPPFDKTTLDPGYIKGYPPGLRENGGQYSHAAMWNILAFTQLGEADKAHNLFALLNPINHARTPEEAQRYKVEPYVVAADVYSVAPHVGRGGWTWYTGAAGWMYRAGMEGILGIHREGKELTIQPCIPPSWPGFKAEIHIENTHYAIQFIQRINDLPDTLKTYSAVILDGRDISADTLANMQVRVPLDGNSHQLTVTISTLPIVDLGLKKEMGKNHDA